MSVPIYLLKKTYNISENYIKIHKNLQVTYKINLFSPEILKKHTNLQENLNNIQIQYLDL